MSKKNIEIELLALDLNTCTRCGGTSNNIEKAIELTRYALEATGREIHLKNIIVDSEIMAQQYQFLSSPTIRINGKDIVFETHETPCQSCTDLCGCDDSVDCRIWYYKGEEYTEAPVGLIVEAILKEVLSEDTPNAQLAKKPLPYSGVPDNLKMFFNAKKVQSKQEKTCCTPDIQSSCCSPEEKPSCCTNPKIPSCGCQ